MSNFIKHIPCEKCGSSDANALFDDDHTYCYGCLTYVAGDGEVIKEKKEVPGEAAPADGAKEKEKK